VETKKKVLVTGATGFIGQHLAERLIAEGWSVRLLLRNIHKLAPSLQSITDIVVGDLSDEVALATAVKGVDVIFHCAANVKTWDTWDNYYSVNVVGLKNLLTAITQENVSVSRFVHLSTVDVYGFPLVPCGEQVAINRGGFGYGDSKILGETALKEYAEQFGLPYTIIRPANVMGPGSQFVERIGVELKSGLMLKINGGRSNAGFVYVDNLIDYLMWAAIAKNAQGQCYNVRDHYDVSWAQFLNTFREGINGKGLVISLPFFIADIFARICEVFYKLFLPTKEPLLHRLLVRFFGRTCGHSAEKICISSQMVSKVGFDEAMKQSCRWFLEQYANNKNK